MTKEVNPAPELSVDALLAENRQMREVLKWVVKNSLDASARRRAHDLLRQVAGASSEDFPVDWANPEIDGEWCI